MPTQTVKGTFDVFGDTLKKILYVENISREFLSSLGFEEIRTPIIEYQEVFSKSLGEVSDIVMHQMYSFEDKDGSYVVLRPEGTAPSVRFYINNLQFSKPRAKIFYIGPMFRRERPQRNRYRQFTQVGCEIFGFESPETDAYLIYVASLLLKKLKVEHTIFLNSIGCINCRPRYSEKIREYVSKLPLCQDCEQRKIRNPLRILDCKIDSEKLQEIPLIPDFWCDECRKKFQVALDTLSLFSVEFKHEPKLVRGLDYYTGIVFEVYHPSDLKSAILAGGRYDYLVEFMGGRKTPACGFAMGVERICNFFPLPSENKRDGIFISYTPEARENAFLLFKRLTELKDSSKLPEFLSGKRIDINLDPSRSLKSQIRYADSEMYRFVIIIGKDEVSRGVIAVRDLEKSEQFEIPENFDTG